MIKIRLDVDYAYPSRIKGFVYTALKKKYGKDYLKNSKTIARMINESPMEVLAYWFFTPYTTPDKELLELLTPDKHEVALHVATNPYGEWEQLEKMTNRKVKFYTVHGTARLLARIIWRRKLWEGRAPIPKDFPLKSFYEFPTIGFDRVCYNNRPPQATQIAKESIAKGEVLHIHPEWLFQRGTFNHRGPFYQPLRTILHVDEDLANISIRKKGFVRIARHIEIKEYEQENVPSKTLLEKLNEQQVDIFTFLERRWCCPISSPPKTWIKSEDNIGLLELTTYNEWLEQVGKKTRNMIRKAEKNGIKVEVVKPDDRLAEGISKIYNEAPIRQGRPFPRFGQPLETIKEGFIVRPNDVYIGAYLQGELIGFIQLVCGDRIAIISQILSLQKYSDKAVNNALVAKAVQVSALKGYTSVMYGRMGNHPSLDNFKKNNGFVQFSLSRYYIALTRKGRMAIRLGLHKDLKDSLPPAIKTPLFPIYSWLTRNKQQLKF